MITKIRLKNWKSHLDSEFSFSPGVNTLIGIMGSGKSSVIEALSFALFGTFPTLHSKRVALDDLIMQKPRRKERSTVELEFRANGRDYCVKRVLDLGRGTSMAELRENGAMLEVNAQGVTREVERILQIDYELFSKAVYSEQNGLDYFLRIPRGQRMQHIDRMLKVDRFEKAREGTVSLANRVKQGNEEKKRVISDLEKEGLGDRISELEREMDKFEGDRTGLQRVVEKAKKGRESLEERLHRIEGKEKELNDSKVELQGIKSGRDEIVRNIRDKRKRLGEFGDLPERSRGLESEIKGMRERLEEMNSDIVESRDAISSMNTEIKMTDDSIGELGGLGAKCPVCESPVTKERKAELLESRGEKREELRERVNKLALELKGKDEAKRKLEGVLREKELEKERVSSMLGEAGMLRELEKREEACDKREGILAKRIRELESLLEKEDIKSIRDGLRDYVAREAEAETKLLGIGERIADRQDILKGMRARKDMMEKYRGEVRLHEEIAGDLERFTDALRVTQNQLREEFLKTVNSIMDDIWGELYPYGDFDGIRLAIENGDYLLQLRGAGTWTSVEGIVSGGERSMACLALRVAFSLAFIPNLKWLILDEPTHNLDSNAIEHFSNILRERMGNLVDQVFIITHEEKMSEGTSGSLYRLVRNKEANEPTRLVEDSG